MNAFLNLVRVGACIVVARQRQYLDSALLALLVLERRKRKKKVTEMQWRMKRNSCWSKLWGRAGGVCVIIKAGS
jgi:hypothetical protein